MASAQIGRNSRNSSTNVTSEILKSELEAPLQIEIRFSGTCACKNSVTFGVLKLTLHPTSYDWQFIPVAGQTLSDSGTDTGRWAGFQCVRSVQCSGRENSGG